MMIQSTMRMIYPNDFINKILNTDCFEVINQLPDEILDAVLIDPPYGEAMGYQGDDTIHDANSLLKRFLNSIVPKMKPNAHLVCFWTMRNLDICLDAVRSAGLLYRRTLSMYLPRGNARPYLGWLPRTQSIVVSQKYLPQHPTQFHSDLAVYLMNAIQNAGLTRSGVAKRLGCDSRLVMKWTRIGDPSWCLPTPRFYQPLKELLQLDDQYDILLTRESSRNLSDDIEYKHDTYIVDDKHGTMLHPSQKPLEVIEHIVKCIALPNGVVFDGFGGSGTTALACRNTGRNFISTEVSEEFCKVAQSRLMESSKNNVVG